MSKFYDVEVLFRFYAIEVEDEEQAEQEALALINEHLYYDNDMEVYIVDEYEA